MRLLRLNHLRLLATGCLAGALATAGWAQVASQQELPSSPSSQSTAPRQLLLSDYTKPKSHFPNPVSPYTPRHLPPPILSNTPRINDLLKNGKLYISINDAVALALENNLDIGIARYNLSVADTDILRAKAGASILGVPTGIVQGTPGGGVGGLGATSNGSGPGGTTAASGGAGAGAGGLVSSTLGIGPTITSFDPVITGSGQIDHATIKCTSPFCGTQQNSTTANFSYLQGFQWGTNMLVGFNNSRVTTNNPIQLVSPTLSSNFQFRLTQHLLQGLGFAPNTRFIRIAKNDREISDVAFRLQVTFTVDQIQNLYWDLVFAYENLLVQKSALALAQKTLSDTQKQVDIGSLAPIEIVRAQSTVATNQQSLIVAETNLALQQLLMKNALSRTLVDPALADAEVIPTDTMDIPAVEPVFTTQDLVNDALNHRPELSEARINLTNSEISSKAIRNSLLPSLDFFAYYGGSGQGGVQNPAATCTANTPPEFQNFCSPPGTIPSTSYGGTFSQLFDSTAPDKGVGLSLTIPLRNRSAQATQIRSELEYRQAQMRVQQIENTVRIEVRNAQFTVQQNRAAVSAAQAAVELAKQSLDAEQKKYALGASTTTLVLQNQTSLTQAESNLVAALANYEKSHVELDRATGLLLDHAGVSIADAERGQVTHMPNIPFVAPRKDPVSQPLPKPGQPQPQNQQQPQTQPQ
ncbi:MAG TPA: TolC family protein [Terriglobales bacterium]|nr:TolC family protein [Terriglobales bacterium]